MIWPDPEGPAGQGRQLFFHLSKIGDRLSNVVFKHRMAGASLHQQKGIQYHN
jgi:hypothetical protein